MSPYLTVAEFKAAPTGIGTMSLTQGGGQTAQDAELYQQIVRASSWIDNFIGVPLSGHTTTAVQRVTVDRYGCVNLHRPGECHLVSITSLAVGSRVGQLTSVNVSAAWVDQDSFNVPLDVTISSLGAPIQFGTSRGTVLTQYTYVSGWGCTVLAADPTAGASTVTVADGSGFQVGETVTIWDGVQTETVVLSAVAGTLLTFAPTLTYTHTRGSGVAGQVAVYSIPSDVRQAAMWITGALIKNRGSDTLTMNQFAQPGPQDGPDVVAQTNLRLARETLGGYQRAA